MIEVWKEINGYEGVYEVSNLGRVKSLKYNKTRILKQTVHSNGYFGVTLYLDNSPIQREIHVLVAIAFLKHVQNGYVRVIDHIDNNPLNNNLNNLRIISHRENVSKRKKKYSSKFPGVHLNAKQNKWFASIYMDGSQKHIGSFRTEIEAKDAYQKELNELLNRK